jgi:thiamine-monophosphate kinase
LPRGFSPEFVDGLYAGLSTLARRYEVAVVGGEITTNPERLLLSVALLGWVERGKAVLRSGGEAGDALFVTGELGGSPEGKHLDFEPRLAEARWLADQFSIHAMIDLSDGLAGDLRHILKASGVGAELLAAAIPISRAARQRARSKTGASVAPAPGPAIASSATTAPKTPLLAALTDGEDFELLFAAAARDAVPLLDAWRIKFPKLALACIGKLTEKEGITIRDKEGVRPLTAHGYVHFA